MGGRLSLFHSPHFTLLTDADEQSASNLAGAMEDAYKTFYREVPAIGLRPLPPPGRLVCVLFERNDDYRDFLKRFEGVNVPWAAGYYSWRTNRTTFFNDRDNPVFKDIREEMAQIDARIGELRAEMDRLAPSDTSKRVQIRDNLRRSNATLADMDRRLRRAANLATLAKTRHEATHQLFYNSGLQRRGRDYPFWLNEGLATNFEVCDAEGRAGPNFTNTYRLQSYRELQKSGGLLPLSEVLTQGPEETEESGRVVGRYAQAWALVHFLWNKHPEQ